MNINSIILTPKIDGIGTHKAPIVTKARFEEITRIADTTEEPVRTAMFQLIHMVETKSCPM